MPLVVGNAEARPPRGPSKARPARAVSKKLRAEALQVKLAGMSLAERLAETLSSNTHDCMVCMEYVMGRQAVWSCSSW